ncbi:uncharacterized protein N7511_002239 [Penicillium nucicola]|uniref:uncharacterized protein n=1 Tax=Penicillium nucicola TaxID=1850975 RepID=UPI0025455619|nr:uncharacterized protein N7511_002239 [Penicillium nucicola]KAJ5770188.1 hypothetical protein N7511_002239 [Penicillium nucicola]
MEYELHIREVHKKPNSHNLEGDSDVCIEEGTFATYNSTCNVHFSFELTTIRSFEMTPFWSSRAGVHFASSLRCVQRSQFPVAFNQFFALSPTKHYSSKNVGLLNCPFGTASRQYHSKIVVRVPPMAESITEGTLNRLNKRIGEFIERDEELATIETDKIDVSVNAPQSGVIKKLLVSEGDVVTVDQEIAEIEAGEQAATHEDHSRRSVPNTDEKTLKKQGPQTTAQPPAQETEQPKYEERQKQRPAPGSSAQTPGQPHNWRSRHSRAEERVKMTRIRQRTAQRLKESQNTTAFLTTFNEVDMSQLIEFRKRNKTEALQRHGVKLGYMGPMARASALALREIPAINASIEGEDTILYRDYVDLSIAAAIPKGLVTPVLRNVESMSILEIEKGIAELVKKARDGKLTIDDMMGGSFTISNSGLWGSLFGTPIINVPQTAVLGTYGIQDRPVAVDGQVEIKPMMYIALTYDHRLVDGREAVTFLTLIKRYLEDPETMLLSL